jgi:hypothetical protein
MVASDKKRWNTKSVPDVPDVPEPLVIGVTRARMRGGVPKEPGTSGTTGTAAGSSIKWFTENLANPGFQQQRDRRARVHHAVPLTGTDPRKGAHL